MIKWHLSQGCRNFSISTNQSICYATLTTEELKKKKPMIISTDVEKPFDKIHQPFMTKTLQQVGIEGNHLNIIKALINPRLQHTQW